MGDTHPPHEPCLQNCTFRKPGKAYSDITPSAWDEQTTTLVACNHKIMLIRLWGNPATLGTSQKGSFCPMKHTLGLLFDEGEERWGMGKGKN